MNHKHFYSSLQTGVLPYDCKTCDKKFRYKISLRTHKCTGVVTVVQEMHQSSLPEPALPPTPPTMPSNDIETLPAVDDLLNLDCSQALDEFVTESYNRMGIVDSNDSAIGHVSDQSLINSNFFPYNIDASPAIQNHTNHVQEHQPFGHIPRLPSMQELLSPSSHQQPSMDAINELFLCHDEYWIKNFFRKIESEKNLLKENEHKNIFFLIENGILLMFFFILPPVLRASFVFVWNKTIHNVFRIYRDYNGIEIYNLCIIQVSRL